MPMQPMTIEIRLVRRGGRERATELVYMVEPEVVPAPGLNLTAPQKTKLAMRLQELALLLDENDSVL